MLRVIFSHLVYVDVGGLVSPLGVDRLVMTSVVSCDVGSPIGVENMAVTVFGGRGGESVTGGLGDWSTVWLASGANVMTPPMDVAVLVLASGPGVPWLGELAGGTVSLGRIDVGLPVGGP